MTFKKILSRLAIIPLTYVTVLGACGSDPVSQPMDVASITAPRVDSQPTFVAGDTGAIPLDAERLQIELADVKIKLGKPRLDPDSLAHFPTLVGDVYVDVVSLDVVDAGTEVVVDAGVVEAADAGTPCDEGGLVCEGSCINPVDDSYNCGGCGIVCGAAETCQNGFCTAGCNE